MTTLRRKARSMKLVSATVSALALAALYPFVASADADPATGVWQVYNDDHAANGRVRTFVSDGKLVGVVTELRPGVPADTTCTKCSGEQKDRPIVGLTVLWGLKKDGDSWSGGTILDPETGSTYKCTVKFVPPSSLELRGYVGFSLFGRTQTWRRAP